MRACSGMHSMTHSYPGSLSPEAANRNSNCSCRSLAVSGLSGHSSSLKIRYFAIQNSLAPDKVSRRSRTVTVGLRPLQRPVLGCQHVQKIVTVHARAGGFGGARRNAMAHSSLA